MSIDWLTVAAQIVNFLVLLWLLKRFLYRPILDGIDARESEIAERLSAATRAGEEAERAQTEYRAQTGGVQRERESVLEAARRTAETERDKLLADTRERLAAEREASAAAHAEQARRYGIELHRIGAEALLSLTRKALADLADETLEQRIVTHLAADLSTLSGELGPAAGESREGTITTHEALPQALRAQLEGALERALPGVTLRYQVDPEQSPGLVLRLGSARLGWTLDSYVDRLETELQASLAAHVAPSRPRGHADAA